MFTELQYVEKKLQGDVEQANAIRAKMLEQVQSDNFAAVMNELSWLQDRAIAFHRASLAQAVCLRASKTALVEALRYMVDWAKSELLRNAYRGGSSSPFHNAVDDAKREATARFLSDYEGSLERIEKQQQ